MAPMGKLPWIEIIEVGTSVLLLLVIIAAMVFGMKDAP